MNADQWNKKYAVGTPVVVTKDNGTKQEGTTTSEAFVVGKSSVIMVSGISGWYLLERVKAVKK